MCACLILTTIPSHPAALPGCFSLSIFENYTVTWFIFSLSKIWKKCYIRRSFALFFHFLPTFEHQCASFCADGASLTIREEVKIENGRSSVLGSSLSESEGSELMEGAAGAAVGRQHSLRTTETSLGIWFTVVSDSFVVSPRLPGVSNA